jgi:hypothetical protein
VKLLNRLEELKYVGDSRNPLSRGSKCYNRGVSDCIKLIREYFHIKA